MEQWICLEDDCACCYGFGGHHGHCSECKEGPKPQEQQSRLEKIERCPMCKDCQFEVSFANLKIECMSCGEHISIDTTAFNE